MENKFKKFLYFFIAMYAIVHLIIVCIISPLPRIPISFLYILLLIIIGIIFFLKYEYEKNNIYIENSMSQIHEIAEKYPNVKKAVDFMTDIIYDNLPNSFKSYMVVTIDYNDFYLLDFYFNLQAFAKNKNLELNELSNLQQSACLIDALSGSTSWILQSSNIEDFENNKKMTFLNIELAIKSSLLFLDFTIDEINNMNSCIQYIAILIFEAIAYDSLGVTMVLSMITDFLETLKQRK